MLIILALDIDDTLFYSDEKNKVAWTYSKVFWQSLINYIFRITKREKVEFKIAIITAKSSPDDLVYHALDTFSRHIDLGFKKADTDVPLDAPGEVTFCYQDYEGEKNIVQLMPNGHFSPAPSPDNDAKEVPNRSSVFILNTRKRFDFIREKMNLAIDNHRRVSDDNILEFNSDVIEKIRECHSNYLLTKTHALQSLLKIYDIEQEHAKAVILIDDRKSIVDDAKKHGFQSVQVNAATIKADELRAKVGEQIHNAISLYKEKEWEHVECQQGAATSNGGSEVRIVSQPHITITDETYFSKAKANDTKPRIEEGVTEPTPSNCKL
jgi:hypothetical protein